MSSVQMVLTTHCSLKAASLKRLLEWKGWAEHTGRGEGERSLRLPESSPRVNLLSCPFHDLLQQSPCGTLYPHDLFTLSWNFILFNPLHLFYLSSPPATNLFSEFMSSLLLLLILGEKNHQK